MRLGDLFNTLNGLAPIELSYKMIEKGEYDNSGIIISSHDEVKKILFSLDLSVKAVEKAKRLNADTIVTHHPAIYTPLKKLDGSGSEESIVKAVNNRLNVISMHLNLDLADNGIDASLLTALGGEKYKIIDFIDESHGYGREFNILPTKLCELKRSYKKSLRSQRIISYGNSKRQIKKIASFCGGGSGFALEYVKSGKTDAELIVTSDMPHHIIKELVERDKCIILLTHYSAENYGFHEFYLSAKKELKNKAEEYYFEDKRFM